MLIVLLVDSITHAGRTHAAGEVIDADEAFARRLIDRDEAHADPVTEAETETETDSDPAPGPRPKRKR